MSGRVNNSHCQCLVGLHPWHHDLVCYSTFIGIAVHTATATGTEQASADLAAGVRQDASGLLGTTLQLSDLVSYLIIHSYVCKRWPWRVFEVIPFVAGGFLYIGAVAVLPTYVFFIMLSFCVFLLCPEYWHLGLLCSLLAESKSAKQAMREVGVCIAS